MATEEEEFEFRARAERESGQQAPKQSGFIERTEQANKLLNPMEWALGGYRAAGRGAEELGHKAGDFTLKATGSPGAATAVDVGVGMLAGGGIGGGAERLAGREAESLMSSALKVTGKLKSSEVARDIKTMLNEGIPVTEGGLRKLRGKVGELNNEITKAISSSSATIRKSEVAKHMRDVVQEFKKGLTPGADLEVLRKKFNEFMGNQFIPKDIPVQQAQELKKFGYKQLGGKEYAARAQGASMQSPDILGDKALIRGLKEGIAKAVPEVGPLNQQESKLLSAMSPLEKRIIIEGRKNPAGLAWLVRDPAAGLAFLADRSSAFKSYLALGLNKSSKTHALPVAGAVAGGTVADKQRSLREYEKSQGSDN